MPETTKAIRELADDQLATEVKQLREELFKLRWQSSHGQLANPSKIRVVRKDIARHLTVAAERARPKVASQKAHPIGHGASS